MTGAMQAPRGRVLFLPAKHGLRGTVRPPGDKSVSHRALLLGAVNDGPVEVRGFLRSSDTLATVGAVRALGVKVEEQEWGVTVAGAGWSGLREPADVIDVANSGTLMRLLPGIVASCGFFCVLTGDASIRTRPMARVLQPLAAMGATVAGRAGNSLPPVTVLGGRLRAIEHTLAVSSAQVKSCLLLAGLQADGATSVFEPSGSRDHTERLVRYGGGRVERDGVGDGPGTVRVWPVDSLHLPSIDVPGDLSSAAFMIVAALLVPDSELTVEGVGLNPTRTGLLRALQRMGGDLGIVEDRDEGVEPTGRIRARTSELHATDVEPAEIAGMIDELPLFLLAAAKAKGTSRVRGAGELRVKESDRLATMAHLLSALGVSVVERPDGLDVTGNQAAWPGTAVQTVGDHRLAMVGAVAGLVSSEGVTIDDADCMAVSYPAFINDLADLGGSAERLP